MPGAEDTFPVEVEQWRRDLEVVGRSPETIKAYTREIRALTRATDRPLVELKTEDLRTYFRDGVGAVATRARRLAAFRSFFGWLVRNERRDDDPTIRLDKIKVKRGLPKPVDDVDAFLRQLDVRAQLVAIFLLETGLRISEAFSFTRAARDTIRVHGKGDKERIVPLSAEAIAALDWLGGRMPVKARTIQRWFHEADCTPHRLRHTFATGMADDDVDITVIQDLLGHESPATTRIYTRVKVSRLRAAIDRKKGQAA